MNNDISNSKISPDSESSKTLIRWLQKNKIYFETVTASLLSLMAIIISGVQIQIGCRQSEIAATQLILNSEPVLVLEPSSWIEGKDWIFNSNLKNIGLSDVYDIEIYENLFSAPSDLDAKVRLSIDVIQTLPTKKYPKLQKNDSQLLTLDTSPHINKDTQGVFRFYRLRIDYKRVPDGKKFSMVNVFFITQSRILQNIRNEALSAIPQVRVARQILLNEI